MSYAALGLSHKRSITIGAWYSGSDEAHMGINAVRSLQQMYESVVVTHPDVVKYKWQIDPLVKDADKWDSAWIWYTNDTAVELGRQAIAVATEMAKEYGLPPPVVSDALAQGVIEKGLSAAGKGEQAAGDMLSYLPWILGGIAVVIAVPYVAPYVKKAYHSVRGK